MLGGDCPTEDRGSQAWELGGTSIPDQWAAV